MSGCHIFYQLRVKPCPEEWCSGHMALATALASPCTSCPELLCSGGSILPVSWVFAPHSPVHLSPPAESSPPPGSTRVSPPCYTRNPTMLHPAPHNVSLEGGGHLLPRAMPCSPPPLSPRAGCRPDISKSVPQSQLKQCISYKTSTGEPACFSLCNILQVHEVLDF